MLRVHKFGNLIGTDEMGNEYFENKEYPYGKILSKEINI